MASIFTRIIGGEIPGTFIFQEEHWVGLLDLFPVQPGHLLLIPRVEAALLTELPAAAVASFGDSLNRAARCCYAALSCAGLSILIRDGSAAGQEVPHLHVHLIPRYPGDEAHRFAGGSYGPTKDAAQAAMAAVADKMRADWPAP